MVDLKIQKGKIQAKVQGSRKTPYKVEIRISPVSEARCQDIISRCNRKVGNLEQLLAGNFPEEMKELFQEDGGLFPQPREISLQLPRLGVAVQTRGGGTLRRRRTAGRGAHTVF